MSIQIDSDIPAPERRKYHGGHSKYPWKELKVGQSFVAPWVDKNSANSTVWRAGKTHGVKFVVRKEGKGYRVWRVE